MNFAPRDARAGTREGYRQRIGAGLRGRRAVLTGSCTGSDTAGLENFELKLGLLDLAATFSDLRPNCMRRSFAMISFRCSICACWPTTIAFIAAGFNIQIRQRGCIKHEAKYATTCNYL